MSNVTTELAMEASDKAMQIARLRAENAKLREQSERLFDKTLELATENSKLRELCKLCEREADNAKLRGLVADMREAFIHGNCYRWCEFKEPCDGKCQYIDRMRDLGVEVDA